MHRTFSPLLLALVIAGNVIFAEVATANIAPVTDSFTSLPAVAAPGQAVALRVDAHDPDCLQPPCTSGCGAFIRSESLTWSDSSGRVNPFTGSTPSPSGSPWNASVQWIAPSSEGVYTVRASFADSGDSSCGSSLTRTSSLMITVTNQPAPVIDSFTLHPGNVPVGGTAQLAAVAHDPLGRALTYAFFAEAGTIQQASPSDPSAVWVAPSNSRVVILSCRVTAAGGPAVWSQIEATVEVGRYLRSIEVSEARPTRVAPLLDGRFIVADGSSGSLTAASATGQISWRKSGLRSPVACASSGSEIYVLERGDRKVSVWNSTGEKLRDLQVDAAAPNQLAAGPAPGELSIVDTDAARIKVISSLDGSLLRTIGVGRLSFPTGIAISNGQVAVADAGLGRIVLFNADGTFVRQIGSSTLFVRPQGVTWDSTGRLIVSDSYSGEITVVGADGTLRGVLGGFGASTGAIINPIDVAMLSSDTIAVTTGGGEIPLFRLLSTVASLAPPTNVTAADRTGDDGGAIEVRWVRSADDPPRVTAYRIERAEGPNGAFAPLAETGASTVNWTDVSTIDGACYRYRVVAKDGATEAASADSSCAVSRNDLPPPAPSFATAEAESPFSAVLSWNPVQAPDLAGYRIELASAGAAPVSFTASAQSIRFTASGLAPETQYAAAIRAFDTAGNQSSAAQASFTTYPDVAPPAPVITASDSRTGGAVDVAWSVPQSRVPVSNFQIAMVSEVAGWPELIRETTASPFRVQGAVNRLPYSVTVVAKTPWGRASEPSVPARVVPTAPARALPVVPRTGWDGSEGVEDASGFSATFAMEGEKRELRFQYRSAGARLQFLIDGQPVGSAFLSTDGEWKDGRLEVAKRDLKSPTPSHLLEIQNVDFPQPQAQLALRRLDFVPLAQKDLKSGAFNTVIDLLWTWQESRADLAAVLYRSPDTGATEWVAIPCLAPRSGRCRDPFRPNNVKFAYRLAILSPAGWSSVPDEVKGEAKYDPLPPPVTDLVVEPDWTPDGDAAFKLWWTPLSTAITRDGQPEAITLYRVYARDGSGVTALGEFAAPPVIIPASAFDAARQTLVVRSVDAEGKESE